MLERVWVWVCTVWLYKLGRLPCLRSRTVHNTREGWSLVFLRHPCLRQHKKPMLQLQIQLQLQMQLQKLLN